MRPTLVGYAYVLSAAVLWGTIGVAYKLGIEAGARYEWLIAGRPLMAGLVAVGLVAASRRMPTRWSAVIGLAAMAPLYILYPLAVERIGAALSSVLLYTAPLWVNLASRLLLGEALTARKAVSLSLGLAGVTLISLPGGLAELEPLGLALGLASGVAYAAYIVLARMARVRGSSVEEASIYPLLYAGPATLAFLRPEGLPGALEAPFIAYLAIACTILPYYLHVKGLGVVEAGRASIASLLEPIVAVALSYLVLGERLTGAQLAGSLMVIAAVGYAVTWGGGAGSSSGKRP